MSEGLKLVIEPIKMCEIKLDILKQFAHVSHDENQIHQDIEVAKAVGLPTVIAHGMFISSLMNSRLAMWLKVNSKSVKLMNHRVRFKGMTLLGDEVYVGGEYSETQVTLQAKNQKGEVLVTGTWTYSS